MAADMTGLHAAERRAAQLFQGLATAPYAAALALVALWCVLILPGLASIPVTDRDEARFAQASKQMVESGNYVDIRFQSVPRYKKPIGIYWLQAASVKAATFFGAELTDIFAYRIPSALCALAAVLLAFWAFHPVLGRETALLGAALLASSFTLVFEGHIAKSDAALLASVMLTQGALFRLYLGNGPSARLYAALLWLGLGASILLKGPVGPCITLFTLAGVLFFGESRAWLRHVHWRWGVPLLLAVTLPWFIAIGISSGGEFFKNSLGQDFAGKLASGQESHGAPPGYYLLLFFWSFWPGVLFVTPWSIRALWRERRLPATLFLIAWIVPFWLLIELVPTKLPHYVLPLYPAVALAAAWSLRTNESVRFSKIVTALWAGVAIVQFVALAAAAWIFEIAPFPLILLISLLGLAITALTVMLARKALPVTTLVSALLAAVLFNGAAFGLVLPQASPIWIAAGAAHIAKALPDCGAGPVLFGGFFEPSGVFALGTDTELALTQLAAGNLVEKKARLVFLADKAQSSFEQGFEAKAGVKPAFLGCLDGINLNGRGPMRFLIYANPATKGPGCTPLPQTACQNREAVRWRKLFNTRF